MSKTRVTGEPASGDVAGTSTTDRLAVVTSIDPGGRKTSLPEGLALSPSRAGDFMRCPLLFRFRSIDRIPERPGSAAVRGTLVHAVLEDLFELDAPERTLTAAHGMVGPTWDKLVSEEPDLLYALDDSA